MAVEQRQSIVVEHDYDLAHLNLYDSGYFVVEILYHNLDKRWDFVLLKLISAVLYSQLADSLNIVLNLIDHYFVSQCLHQYF